MAIACKSLFFDISLLCDTHFVVLVGGDGHELSSWKYEDVVFPLGQISNMIGLHYMKPWLVLVHAIHNDLCTYKVDGEMRKCVKG